MGHNKKEVGISNNEFEKLLIIKRVDIVDTYLYLLS